MEIKIVRVLPNPTYFENVCSSDKVVCKVKSNKKGGPCSCKYVRNQKSETYEDVN